MSDPLQIDKEIVSKERERLKLPEPTNFPNGRLDGLLIDKLMPLISLQFNDNTIGEEKQFGFKQKGVHYALQLNRLQDVFGHSHILIEDDIIDYNTSQNQDKNEMHWYRIHVTIKIGNWTIYDDATSNMPGSCFITYYSIKGIGYAGAANKGTAEKNAFANGFKDAVSKMGMLRYLRLDEDDEEGYSSEPKILNTTISLIDAIKIFNTGAIFAKANVKDIRDNSIHEVIIFRDVKSSKDKDLYQNMLNDITKYQSTLVAGKSLDIEYYESFYLNKHQYIVTKIFYK